MLWWQENESMLNLWFHRWAYPQWVKSLTADSWVLKKLEKDENIAVWVEVNVVRWGMKTLCSCEQQAAEPRRTLALTTCDWTLQGTCFTCFYNHPFKWFCTKEERNVLFEWKRSMLRSVRITKRLQDALSGGRWALTQTHIWPFWGNLYRKIWNDD